jgi:branched-chain amino acid aminotransferase/4-amino-4-deoxychorismate lyase
MIDIHDRGFLLGDGLFETILWSEGRLVLFDGHAQRLIRGCEALGLPAPDPEVLKQAAETAVVSAGLVEPRAAVRLTWTAGPGGRGLDRPQRPSQQLISTAAAAPKREAPVRLVTSGVRRNEGSPASRLKTLSYLDNVLARAEARAAGGDEALMLNNRGDLACAAAANLFWVKDGALFTPALRCGVLDGIMRSEVLRVSAEIGLRAHEVAVNVDALAGAEGVFLSNSLIGLCEVAELDRVPVPRAPVVERLREALADVA